MSYPTDLKYTKEHEWVRVDGNTGVVGITDRKGRPALTTERLGLIGVQEDRVLRNMVRVGLTVEVNAYLDLFGIAVSGDVSLRQPVLAWPG